MLPAEGPSIGRRILAEAMGTAFLLAIVIGSGIMGERLAGGNVAIALLANTLATGTGLATLILTFGSISGAHFNPVVTLAEATRGKLGGRDVLPYLAAQIGGAFAGAALAHFMFGEPTFSASHHDRGGFPQVVSELVATFGLLSVIRGCEHARPTATPFAVGAYISAAYWFTSSTSFANPAVTLARAASNTFAGIRPADAPGFIAAQILGAAAATAIWAWLLPTRPRAGSRPTSRPSRPRSLMKTVLFACIHNAGRSQMAAAWFNALANPALARAVSAGTEPGARVHPEVLAAMREVGLDLSAAVPTLLTRDLAETSQLLVTMGCGESCPVVPGLRREDWPLDDPKGKPLPIVREIRDDVRQRVAALLAREGWGDKASEAT